MKQAFTNTSSSRSVSMRDIKSFSSGLYPALQACGVTRPMAHCTHGFTLIELLVVVLIIGILAAVALPQYQRAVDKSRYATMIQTARSIEAAQDAFYLENGYYATDWDDLSVSLSKDLPRLHDGRVSIDHAGFDVGTLYTSAIYYDEGDTRIASFTVYHRNSTSPYKGKIMCFSYGSRKERGDAICKSFGGQLISSNSGCSGSNICNTYEFSTF